MILQKIQTKQRRVWATLLAVNFVGGGAGLVTSFLSNRILGPDGRGELAAIQNIPVMITVFAGLGVSESAVYYVAKFPKSARKITQRALIIALMGGLFFSALAYFAIPLAVQNQQTIDASRSIIWLIIAVPLFTTSYQPLRSLGRYQLWSCMRMYNTGALLVILLLAYRYHINSASSIAMYFAATQYVSALGAILLTRFYDDSEPSPEISSRELLSFGLPSSLSMLPQALNLRFDQVLLMGIVTRNELGLYVAAVSWGAIVSPPFYALAQWIMPHLSAKEKLSALIYARQIALGVVFFSFCLTLVVLPVTSNFFVLVMGTEFVKAISIAKIMLGASILSGMIVVFEEMYRGLGKPRLVLLAEVLGLFVTIPGLFLLTPEYGITGAATVSVLSYFVISMGLLGGLWFLEEVN